MQFRIIRSVVYATEGGRVLEGNKKAVSSFLGSGVHEQRLSDIGAKAKDDAEIRDFIRSITPNGEIWIFAKRPKKAGETCEQFIIAHVRE